MSDTLRLAVPLPPKGKARPKVTRRGTYMPPEYVDWKAAFVAWCHDHVAFRVVGRYAIGITFYGPSGEAACDLDNALGAVLDALQDAGVTENDRKCRRIDRIDEAVGPHLIEITLTALE